MFKVRMMLNDSIICEVTTPRVPNVGESIIFSLAERKHKSIVKNVTTVMIQKEERENFLSLLTEYIVEVEACE